MTDAILLPWWWFILFACSYSSMLLDRKRFFPEGGRNPPRFSTESYRSGFWGSDHESAIDTFRDLEPMT